MDTSEEDFETATFTALIPEQESFYEQAFFDTEVASLIYDLAAALSKRVEIRFLPAAKPKRTKPRKVA